MARLWKDCTEDSAPLCTCTLLPLHFVMCLTCSCLQELCTALHPGTVGMSHWMCPKIEVRDSHEQPQCLCWSFKYWQQPWFYYRIRLLVVLIWGWEFQQIDSSDLVKQGCLGHSVSCLMYHSPGWAGTSYQKAAWASCCFTIIASQL